MKWKALSIFVLLVLARPLWACQGEKGIPACGVDETSWMNRLTDESKATIKQTFSGEIPQSGHTLSSGSPYQGRELFVFISFSMPRAALLELAKQVEMFDGVLVLRGLVNNSIKQTQAKLFEVFGEKYAPRIVIDPLLFQSFDVARVPSFVLCADDVGCRGESCPKQNFDKVSGNMPISSALRVLAEEGVGQGLARKVLARGNG